MTLAGRILPTSLLYAAPGSRHRPASHPVLGGRPEPIAPSPVTPTDDWSQASCVLIARRKARGWTQRHLADAVGVTRTAVSWWECGQTRPSSEHLERLERLLGRLA